MWWIPKALDFSYLIISLAVLAGAGYVVDSFSISLLFYIFYQFVILGISDFEFKIIILLRLCEIDLVLAQYCTVT